MMLKEAGPACGRPLGPSHWALAKGLANRLASALLAEDRFAFGFLRIWLASPAKGVLRFRCGHLQEVACPIDCTQVTVKSKTPGGQRRCENLCSACKALALLRQMPERFAADAEAEVEIDADDEMA